MPLETLAGMIQAEARETAGLFLQKQPSPISDDAVYWVVWQSLLYSGLLVQTLTSLSEKRRLTWIDKQVQAALSTLDI
jgi:sirohydrochlorin ferrochelatase